MPFSFAVSVCLDHAAQSVGAAVPRFYSTDLLPTMQGFLAAQADIETRCEIEREQIEQGAGSQEVKQRRLAELEAAHQHRRDLHEVAYMKVSHAKYGTTDGRR